MSARSTCPHPECAAAIEWDRFACRTHWFALPKVLRGQIGAAWRAVLAGRSGAIEQHDSAKAEALDHWRAS